VKKICHNYGDNDFFQGVVFIGARCTSNGRVVALLL